MKPLVLWLVACAASSVGWRVEWALHRNAITVIEDGPALTHKPRRWLLTAEELPE